MRLSPDQAVYLTWGPVHLNATIVFTWVVMAILAIVGVALTRRLTDDVRMSPLQNLLEALVVVVSEQIEEVTGSRPDRYLPFVGTLFLFILSSNVLAVVPGFEPPTASFSTTAALATAVFFAVPWFGIRERGARAYFAQYVRPTPLMLPFNVIGELSRTLALAVRLAGNVMSGTVIAAILLAIAPLVFPVVMQSLGLLTGAVHAYIFAILALVYIASATHAHDREKPVGGDHE